MKLTDVQAAELAEEKHYHAWALMPMATTIHTGRTMTNLAYVAAKYPHKNRVTARRHAKEMAVKEYGKPGYMALLCIGGDACPFLFDPWDMTAASENAAARHGTETEMETTARARRETEALAQARAELGHMSKAEERKAELKERGTQTAPYVDRCPHLGEMEQWQGECEECRELLCSVCLTWNHRPYCEPATEGA